MAEYKVKLNVDIHDVDFNGVARAAALMRYIQSAAQSQLTDRNLSYDNMKTMKRAFLLSRIRLEFDEPIRAYEPLTAVTYPCESRGYTFIRCYKLERDGATVARAVSAWALIDTESRALVRVNDFDLGLEVCEPLDLTLGRIKMPSSLHDVGEYTVTYSKTDQNRHMNNTAYADMYSHYLPLEGRRIKAISINYLKEAPIGERLRVQLAHEGGFYYIRTYLECGDVNSEAEIELTDII